MGKFVNPKKIKGQDQLNRMKDLMGKMNTLTESKTFYRHDYREGLFVKEPTHIPQYMLLITLLCLYCYLMYNVLGNL